MADTSLNGFWQTLSAQMSDAQKVFAGTFNLTRSVYRNYEPVVATVGQTLNVAIPADVTSSVVNADGVDPVFNTPSFSTVPITFNQFPRYAVKVWDTSQFNSPQLVRDILIDPAIKGIRTSMNNYLWSLVNSTNFNVNTVVSTTGSELTPAQFLGALEVLAEQKVPVTEGENMTFVAAPKIYYGIMGDANWNEYLIAGSKIAERVHDSGVLGTIYGVDIRLDQGAATTGTAPTRTFKSLLFHRYAMALATRPLPAPDGNVVKWGDFLIDDTPIRVMVAYNINVQGYVVIVCAGFGAAVVRPAAGALCSTTEA